jgi:hypothetical protein
MRAALLVGLALSAVVLAGCGAAPAKPAGADVPLAPGRAVLAGVVVDQAIHPIAGAVVTVTDAGVNATTDAKGGFSLAVPVGEHVLEATHRDFAPVRQTVSVPATGTRGLVVQFSLTAAMGPYSTIAKYEGFVVCSLGASYIFSEECGEGVGTPVGRFGKQGNNAIRYDFQAESPSLKTLVVEMAWEPTSDAGRELLVLLNTNWTCEPACGGDAVGNGSVQGPSPLLLRVDEADLSKPLQDPAAVFTTYTLARNGPTDVNVVLNQAFQLFVTQFYRESAPDGYSFVAASA